MPFLKERKESVSERRIKACERNGLRHAIYTPDRPPRIYRGEWKSDKKDGRGSEAHPGRSLLYEGDWSQNRKSGYGELFRFPASGDRQKVYAGYWSNDKKHGFGRYWRADGAYYEGEFQCGLKHGSGRFWHTDGTYYEGDWENDFYHGEGLLLLANGNRYKGPFCNGKRQGRGKYWHMCTGQLQEGDWSEDICAESTMRDIDWRQCTCAPTAYPIPKLGLFALSQSASSTGRSFLDDAIEAPSSGREILRAL